MSRFAPGDVVVCVDASPCQCGQCGGDPVPLIAGRYYTVLAYCASDNTVKYAQERVARSSRRGHSHLLGWAGAFRFRKIDKSDEGFAAWMRSLRPIPAKHNRKVEA